ncbi:Crp/Fnr family transcriptional regulator [Oceanobacillus caeni]|uniref:Crp/Fnr family transcriptional regulator n=1 Tax=Oceanobacillus TaxID=182709 RepID=UPI0006225FCB|nr:Crp/Fnr family transcriptional regulator [Oceanobacillus caeni]KKE79537.1 Crp/Fnr family transcriptional regulator [Bacilli bacterium VT-13-104]PZD89754.1 Crp/Fnr family transcriptional regulator [Bacilli bacterium]MBU8792065.1 Crp/Fnr family transcriptional regulator [Oceanobacillus caeni]MCR1833504.1 Crp/Fnr family transcriptional regulator [Oceanobacillus caeni]PZD91276.1 Crp/Fnr family transcriptional regulator [Bacilli bacterium]
MGKRCHHGISKDQLCVAKVPFFNHLTFDEMEKIADMSRHLNFKKGEIIFSEGDPLEYLYIIHQGRVKNYQLFESGKEQLLRILESGEFMGELALFTEKTLDSYAETIEKTEICAIHRSDMQQLLKQYPTIAIKILEQFSNRLDETEKLVGNLSSKDVETRTASYLLELVDKYNTTSVELPISKKDLASYLGTTSETLSRRLSSFQTNGWIEQRGQRKIQILDREALREMSIHK